MVNMMATIQEALKALPQLTQQLKHFTLQVQPSEVRTRHNGIVYPFEYRSVTHITATILTCVYAFWRNYPSALSYIHEIDQNTQLSH